MTPKTQRKMKANMKRTWKQAVQARKKHNRLMARYTKMQRQYRKAA